MKKVLLVFLDGVGIGARDPDVNPFFTARMPALRGLLTGSLPSLDEPEARGQEACAFPLDAVLGVDGLPQSGTGQTALLTGENAPALYGRHFGPWVPVALRPILEERNLFVRALQRGITCTFANAYPRFALEASRRRRPAGPPLAARAAGLLTRNEHDLAAGYALSSEIVNDGWRDRLGLQSVPVITPAQAGRNLARIARSARLTFFAHYATDLAGHSRRMEDGLRALERVDAFLGSLVFSLAPRTLLFVASDHGNIEDVTAGHTRNPTLSLLVGEGAPTLRPRLSRITDVPDAIFHYLDSEG